MSFQKTHKVFNPVKFKEIRKSQNLTQEDIARFCGVSINTISSIETGVFQPRLGLYLDLCKCLEVPVYCLWKDEL